MSPIAACGRARWKIENETFNGLKNHGYNHNFGHGKDTLASVLVVLNLLAFAMHNACDLAEAGCQEGRRKVRAKMRLFEHIRTITAYLVFPIDLTGPVGPSKESVGPGRAKGSHTTPARKSLGP